MSVDEALLFVFYSFIQFLSILKIKPIQKIESKTHPNKTKVEFLITLKFQTKIWLKVIILPIFFTGLGTYEF